jgi:tetratricopeptide (TPR) repeat protein
MEQALSRSERVPPALQAKAFGTAASLIGRLGDLDRAELCLEKSLSLLRELGDNASIAERLRVLGYVVHQKGDFERAHTLYDESLALFRAANNQEGIYKLLHNMGYLAQCEGDYERASALFREKLARARARGDLWDVCDTIYNVAQILFVDEVNPPFREIHSLLDEGIALATDLGYALRGVDIKALLGWVSFYEGDMATARLLLDESLLFYRKSGRRPFVGLYLPVLARMHSIQGDYSAAYSMFEEALTIGREVGDIEIISPCLLAMAELAVVQKQYAQAVRILGANEKQRETTASIPISSIDCVSYEHSLTAAHAILEEETFTSLWAEGRAMSLDEVLATSRPDPAST